MIDELTEKKESTRKEVKELSAEAVIADTAVLTRVATIVAQYPKIRTGAKMMARDAKRSVQKIVKLIKRDK